MGSVVFQRIGWLILLIICMSIVLLYLFSVNKGVSFGLGAGLSLFPTLLFGQIFFKSKGVRVAKKIINTLYVGELVKMLATMILLVLLFQWRALAPLFLFLGFIITQLSCLLIFL